MLKQLEKSLPTLNTVVPGDSRKKGTGKQKKTYVGDADKEMLQRIVESVAQKVDRGVESKLEKAVSKLCERRAGVRGDLKLTAFTAEIGDDQGGAEEGG